MLKAQALLTLSPPGRSQDGVPVHQLVAQTVATMHDAHQGFNYRPTVDGTQAQVLGQTPGINTMLRHKQLQQQAAGFQDATGILAMA